MKDLFDGSSLILFSQLMDVFAVVVVPVVVVAMVVADVVVVEVVVAVVVVAVLVVAVVVVTSQANTTVQLRRNQGSSTPVFCKPEFSYLGAELPVL